MRIDRFDHLVLTVRDVEVTCSFYARVLGMQVVTFGEGRKALAFGRRDVTLTVLRLGWNPKNTAPGIR